MSTPFVPARAIPRLLTVANGKGGVGKTTTTSNSGGLLAAAGYRVLLVDLDLQGNLGRDLGYPSDRGRALFDAFLGEGELPLLTDVRPNLDVVPGGQRIADLAAVKMSQVLRGGRGDLGDDLYRLLAPEAGNYDLILIDAPPSDLAIVRAALKVSSFLLIPTRSDDGSIEDGLGTVADLFAETKQDNPDLRLAGVLLYGIGSRSSRIEAQARAKIDALIPQDIAPVFHTRIRYVESAAVDARNHGLLIHELEGEIDSNAAEVQRKRLAALARGEQMPAESFLARSASGLATDFSRFTEELVVRVNELEAEVMA